VLGVTVRLMSDGELTRLEALGDLDQKRLTTEAAAQLLGLGRRQVFRLLKAYRTEGATGLISNRRDQRDARRSDRLKRFLRGRACWRPPGKTTGAVSSAVPRSSGDYQEFRAQRGG